LLRDYEVECVRGNHDRWFFELMPHRDAEDRRMESVSLYSRALLSSLPPTRTYLTASGRLLLCHRTVSAIV
jgi:hypothetical protein